MTARTLVMTTGLFLLTPLAGCTHYYQVQDPAGSKIYYTDSIDQKDSGSVVFKDLQTGQKVTLTSSAIKEIPQSELPPGATH